MKNNQQIPRAWLGKSPIPSYVDYFLADKHPLDVKVGSTLGRPLRGKSMPQRDRVPLNSEREN
jgi:hypothetical protein